MYTFAHTHSSAAGFVSVEPFIDLQVFVMESNDSSIMPDAMIGKLWLTKLAAKEPACQYSFAAYSFAQNKGAPCLHPTT